MREKWSRWYKNWSRQLAAVSLADFFTLFIYLQVIRKGERGGGGGQGEGQQTYVHSCIRRQVMPIFDCCYLVTISPVLESRTSNSKTSKFVIIHLWFHFFKKTETTFFFISERGKLSSSIKRRQKGASACRVGRLWLVRGKAVARSFSNNDGDDYENVT